MRQTVKRDKHNEIVRQRARKSAIYRKTFERTLHQIDLALLVREMREDEGARVPRSGWARSSSDCSS